MNQDKHAKYSPSKLPRIVLCPASGLFERTEDQAADNVYASEGSMMHLVVSEALENNEMQLAPLTITKYNLDKPQIDACQECLDYVTALRESYEIKGIPYYDMIETKVQLDGFIATTGCEELREVAGTLDYCLVADNHLYITDWKFGVGIEVFPDSEQLYAYALGKVGSPGNLVRYNDVTLTIVQPRLYSEEHIKSITITAQDLQDWLQVRLIPSLLKIHAKHPAFNPGEKQCRWCPIKHHCEARKAQYMQNAVDAFAMADMLPATRDDVDNMNHLLKVLENADTIRAYLKDAEHYAFRLLTQGLPVPGYKIVHGKSNRAWVDPVKAKDWCLEQGFDEMEVSTLAFKSPAQIEKLLRKPTKISPAFTSLVSKPEGKPTLVSDTDKRPAIDYRTAAEIFAEYTEEI